MAKRKFNWDRMPAHERPDLGNSPEFEKRRTDLVVGRTLKQPPKLRRVPLDTDVQAPRLIDAVTGNFIAKLLPSD